MIRDCLVFLSCVCPRFPPRVFSSWLRLTMRRIVLRNTLGLSRDSQENLMAIRFFVLWSTRLKSYGCRRGRGKALPFRHRRPQRERSGRTEQSGQRGNGKEKGVGGQTAPAGGAGEVTPARRGSGAAAPARAWPAFFLSASAGPIFSATMSDKIDYWILGRLKVTKSNNVILSDIGA